MKTPTGGTDKLTLPNSEKVQKHIDTTEELAKLAGVGHTSYHQAKTVIDGKDEETKKKMLSNQISINAAYNKVKPKPYL